MTQGKGSAKNSMNAPQNQRIFFTFAVRIRSGGAGYYSRQQHPVAFTGRIDRPPASL
ncbi:hypothetical protein GCM10027214_19870 [Stenotrophomonas tumulicola]